MPNMLRCTLAGGGDGASLIVTCTQNFAGSTITLTNGVKTYTQVCPLSSPYEVTFESVTTGVWTVSGIAQGQTFSTSVTITDFEALLADIPEGSTVTPTDDIQIWLHCANIWDKAYTTISQVLADASTLQALISSNNAVDYMVRSTTWSTDVTADSSAMSYIGLNDYCADSLLADSSWLTAICNSTYFENVLNFKIPTMTSDTTPSGEAKCGNTNTHAYYSFDNNINTMADPWNGQYGSVDISWYQYMFTQAAKIFKIKIIPFKTAAYGGKTFKIQYSDDGNTFNDITDNSFDISSVSDGDVIYFNLPIIADAKYWRLQFLTSQGSYKAQVYELQFYGRSS